MADLAAVDTFLGSAESATLGAAHFDEDELEWRTGVNRQDVDLVTADTEVSRYDGPSQTAAGARAPSSLPPFLVAAVLVATFVDGMPGHLPAAYCRGRSSRKGDELRQNK